MNKMKTKDKAIICMILAFGAALLSIGATGLGGLWCLIIPVMLFTIVESIYSCVAVACNSKTALWFGLLFHLTAAGLFLTICGAEIFQDFHYTIDYGHGNFDLRTDDAQDWWFLIGTLAFRVVMVEPILLIKAKLQ